MMVKIIRWMGIKMLPFFTFFKINSQCVKDVMPKKIKTVFKSFPFSEYKKAIFFLVIGKDMTIIKSLYETYYV